MNKLTLPTIPAMTAAIAIGGSIFSSPAKFEKQDSPPPSQTIKLEDATLPKTPGDADTKEDAIRNEILTLRRLLSDRTTEVQEYEKVLLEHLEVLRSKELATLGRSRMLNDDYAGFHAALKQRYGDLYAEVTKLDAEVQQQESRIDKLKEDSEKLRKDVTDTRDDSKRLKETLEKDQKIADGLEQIIEWRIGAIKYFKEQARYYRGRWRSGSKFESL